MFSIKFLLELKADRYRLAIFIYSSFFPQHWALSTAAMISIEYIPFQSTGDAKKEPRVYFQHVGPQFYSQKAGIT